MNESKGEHLRCRNLTLPSLPPFLVFVTRNIANLVVNTDMSLLAVLEYAVHVLEVKDIFVVGHYQCTSSLPPSLPPSLNSISLTSRSSHLLPSLLPSLPPSPPPSLPQAAVSRPR